MIKLFNIILLVAFSYFIIGCVNPINDNDGEKTPTTENLDYRMDGPLRTGLKDFTNTDINIYKTDQRDESGERRNHPMDVRFMNIKYSFISKDKIYLYMDALYSNPRKEDPKGPGVIENPDKVALIKIRYEGVLIINTPTELNSEPLSRKYATLLIQKKEPGSGPNSPRKPMLLNKNEKHAYITLEELDIMEGEIKFDVIINRVTDQLSPFKVEMEFELEV